MKVLTRYIALRTFNSILLTFLIITAIIMLVDFVESSRNIGDDANLNAGQILLLTLLKTPQLIEKTIPFVTLFGVMGALYSMNRRSELIVLRASGLSAWKFLLPTLSVVLLLGSLWALVFNPLASGAALRYDQQKIYYEGKVEQDTNAIWLREGDEFGQTIIYAADFNLLNRNLHQAEFTIFKITHNGQMALDARYDAEQAILLPGGYWQLNNVIESLPNGEIKNNRAIALPTTITPRHIQEAQSGNRNIPLWALPEEIAALGKAGFSNQALKIQLHKLLALPLALTAMAVIAAAVSMRLTRQGGTLRFILSGAAIGFSVFFMENMIQAFGETGTLSAAMAVWTIPLTVLFIGLIYLSYIEDG